MKKTRSYILHSTCLERLEKLLQLKSRNWACRSIGITPQTLRTRILRERKVTKLEENSINQVCDSFCNEMGCKF